MKVLTVIFFLVTCYLVVFFAYRSLSRRRKQTIIAMDSSYDILKEIKTNNSYPLILDVFTSLNSELSKCNEELHMDLRGYLDAEKAK